MKKIMTKDDTEAIIMVRVYKTRGDQI